MHAIIQTGGKQYRVTEGDRLRVEKLFLEEGETVEFDQVLMLSSEKDTQVGSPLLSGVKVTAEVLEQGRAKKVGILKFKRRKHHMKRMGHRQSYTLVKITQVGSSAAKPKKAAAKKEKAAE